MKGRPLGDPSNAQAGSALIEGNARELVRASWGDIKHPTLKELVNMILIKTDQVENQNDLVLWKMDLSNAFGLLNIAPTTARLIAFALHGGLTAVYIIGIFGWVGTPFAFDPISRTIRRQVNRLIKGRAEMFVDDLMGVSEEK
jgi:hypothetical protein